LGLLRNALLGAPATVAAREAAPRLGLCRTPWWEQAEPASQAAVEAAGQAFAEAGAALREYSLPADFAPLTEANQTIMVYEGRRSLAGEFARHEDKLSPRLKEALAAGTTISYADYQQAVGLAERCRRALDEVFSDLDALLVPSVVGEAPEGLASTGNALFNRAWTTLGAPCVTLPGHTGPTGLPVGVQLVGNRAGDEALLSVAAWAEAALAPT
jgi:Asp-tRNA(Asn)/Glu-tRNA(Gln) amidotransferase A subunit family amidase